MALNNNQVATVINSAVAMSTGAETIANMTLKEIIDTGNDATVISTKENFTKALCNVIIKNWFTDSAYRSEYSDPWLVDSEQFGGIVQNISIDYPSAQPSHAWNDFENGVSKVGQYDVYIPVINTQLYGKSVSWEIPVTVTGEQWDTAFKSESDLATFTNYIFMCVDNAIIMHLESLDFANRNNFMAEKISYAKTPETKGIHVINLVQLYHDNVDSAVTTTNKFLNDENCLRFACTKIAEISDYFTKMSTLFNTAGKNRFTPKSRQVLQLLSYFDKQIVNIARANTFHEELIKIPNFETVPYWQGSGEKYEFADTSKIIITDANTSEPVTQSGIVAFLADKWAIMHTIKSRRTAVKVYEPENLTTYFNQFRDMYMNDLTMNAVVFTVENVE